MTERHRHTETRRTRNPHSKRVSQTWHYPCGHICGILAKSPRAFAEEAPNYETCPVCRTKNARLEEGESE